MAFYPYLGLDEGKRVLDTQARSSLWSPSS